MGVKVVHRPGSYAQKLKGGLGQTMREASLYLQGSANRKINRGISPDNAPLTQAVKRGSKTLRDSNNLASSIAPHNGPLWADASTNAMETRILRILQEGGTIKSKGKGLWIPAGYRTRQLMRVFNATGPGDLIQKMKDAGYQTFFTPLSKVFCAQKGKRGKPFALFLVKSSVRIPARPFLYIDAQDEKYLVNFVRKAVMNKLKE